jgi:signal transduction histidine kinase
VTARPVTDDMNAGDVVVGADAGVVDSLVQTIVRQLPGGVAIVEAPSGQVVIANAEATRLLGDAIRAGSNAAATLRGAAFHPDGSPFEPDEWPVARSLARGETVLSEVAELTRGDGTHAILEITSAPIRDEHGRITAAVVLVFDVSERESKERAEREFVTNAAHELQTPLAGIMSAVDVLQAGAKHDPADRDRFLAHVERECRRLDRLARALFVLARVQMGVETPRPELVELRPLLDEVAADLTPAPDVRVEIDCSPELALVASRELASHLLGNLASNAAKFTARGRILFRARPAGESEVTIEVEDTGPGIGASEQRRVFERFYRGSAGEAGSGVGLGLAIAKAATDALGGSLEIASTPGEGTTMTVTLPGAMLLHR